VTTRYALRSDIVIDLDAIDALLAEPYQAPFGTPLPKKKEETAYGRARSDSPAVPKEPARKKDRHGRRR